MRAGGSIVTAIVGVAFAAIPSACIEPELVACGDGRLCPVGTVCEPIHQTCVMKSQLSACESLADGEPCVADATPGICDQAVCLPGCGDGVQGAGEECDDGNFLSHDGCSSQCERELLSWSEWQSPWVARSGQVLAYHEAADVLVMFGGSVNGVISDDHWQRDRAGTWHELTSSPRPPPRKHAAMAYDASRARLVLFGGLNDSGNALGDTWEFDGTAWTQAQPTLSPSARGGAALVFDDVRQRIVLFGGAGADIPDDTWEYDGTTWTLVPSATRPPGRASHSMVWDAARSRIVMFGGGNVFIPYGDTWERVGTAWSQVTTPTSPGIRSDTAMAFSTARGKVILFGGGNAFADLWEYSATGWQQLPATKTQPAGRRRAAMAADPVDGTVVLVGGEDLYERSLDDVWKLDANAIWRSRPAELSPTPRESSVAADDRRDALVLFAGTGNTTPDTWSFDGSTWTEGPPPAIEHRLWHAAGYDPLRDRTIVFGGLDLQAFAMRDDTFELDASTGQWTQRTDVVRPPKRIHATLGFDGSHLVLFGGSANDVPFADTWELDATGWRETTAPGGPAAQEYLPMTYDPIGQRLVAFDDAGTTWAYAGGAWTPLPLTDAPLPRKGAGLAFDHYRNRLVLYGGYTNDTTFSDVWELGDDGWIRQDLIGNAPTPRLHFALHGQRHARGLVMFGGTTGTTLFGDTWYLQRRSSTPDENCSNGTDDDGDRHVDANDPDCTILN